MAKYSLPLVFFLLFSCSTAPKKMSTPANIPSITTNSSDKPNEPLAFAEVPLFISKELTKRMPERTANRVGVLNFTNLKGGEVPEGKLLAEKLISELTSIEGVTVVEREHLSQVLEEQILNMSGVTTETEQEAGTVLSVDLLISGTMTSLNGKSEITAKLTDVKTGEIYGAIALKTVTNSPVSQNENTPQLNPRRYPPESETDNKAPGESGFTTPKIRAELSVLKRVNPSEFKSTRKLLRSLMSMKESKPGLFILVTEPRGSEKIHRLKKLNPKKFLKLKKTRKRLFTALRLIPSLKPELRMHRRAVLAQLSGRNGNMDRARKYKRRR